MDRGDGDAGDAGFIDALVANLTRRLCVDSNRAYAVGHSNGGAFAAVLACWAPQRFAAVATVSATTPSTCPAEVTPALLAIHGTADPAVPYQGGANELGRQTPLPPAPEIVKGWASAFHCTMTPAMAEPTVGVRQVRYTGCVNGSEVVLDTCRLHGDRRNAHVPAGTVHVGLMVARAVDYRVWVNVPKPSWSKPPLLGPYWPPPPSARTLLAYAAMLGTDRPLRLA